MGEGKQRVKCLESGKTEEVELDANRDKWLNTKETIDYGLIDFEIGAKRKKKPC